MVPFERTPPRPSPWDFDDYRLYLEALVAHLSEHSRWFSYRSFAQRAGYSSPGFLSDVIKGRRGLTSKGTERFIRGFRLSEHEAHGFEALVAFSQAKSDEERNRHYQRLRELARKNHAPRSLGDDQYDVYSLWYAMPIREMMLLPDFCDDPEWVAARMHPSIRPGEAKKALKLLEHIGLAVRGEDGRLRPADPDVATPDQIESPARALAIRNYHRSLLEKAAGTLDQLPQDERQVVSLTLALTPEQYKELSRRNMEYLREIMSQSDEWLPNGGDREVYVLGVQLTPATMKGKDGK